MNNVYCASNSHIPLVTIEKSQKIVNSIVMIFIKCLRYLRASSR